MGVVGLEVPAWLTTPFSFATASVIGRKNFYREVTTWRRRRNLRA